MTKLPFSFPTYSVRRVTRPPAVDGWLQSPCWNTAAWVDTFRATVTAEAIEKATAAAMLWDDQYLYIAIRGAEPRPAYLRADATEPMGTWGDDSVEVYLDAGLPGITSVDFSVNFAGMVCPLIRRPADGSRTNFEIGGAENLRTALRFTRDGWQVEMAIPFGRNSLPFPAEGTKWRGNICRNDRTQNCWSSWDPGIEPAAIAGNDTLLFPYLKFSPAVAERPCRAGRHLAWPRKPRFPMRGFMYDTSRGSIVYKPGYWQEHLGFYRDLGFNTIQMYFENHMRYRSHPEFAPEGSWTPQQLAELQDKAATFGIDIIPSQTSLGHCPGILTSKAYRHLAEEGSNFYQFCPSHPQTQQVLGDIFSELASVSRSPYISINADESGFLGLCPRCRKKFPGWTPGQIYRHHVMFLHDVLHAHGKRMMMWDDMLWGYPDALEGLARDIILLDWHYGIQSAFPSVDLWRQEGFEVVVCPGMYYAENCFQLCDYGAPRGVMGVINTIWEDHSMPMGVRWEHFLATSWAGCKTGPADFEDWSARAANHFFGPGAERMARSQTALDQFAQYGYRGQRHISWPVHLQAQRQLTQEAQDTLANTTCTELPREMLQEYVYSRRLSQLRTETGYLKGANLLTPARRKQAAREAAELKREALARWQRQCTVPSQKEAFLAPFTAVEKMLAES